MAERKAPRAADLTLLDPDGSFVCRLRADRDTLTKLASGLWATPAAMEECLAEIEALAHRLAGAAGTFGYPQVGIAALDLESRITAGTDGPHDCSAIEASLAGLRVALDNSLGMA